MENSLDLKTAFYVFNTTAALILLIIAKRFWLISHAKNQAKQINGLADGLFIAAIGGSVIYMLENFYQVLNIPHIPAQVASTVIGIMAFYYLLKKVI